MEKKLQKPYPANYNFLIVKDLSQAHYQILLVILLKKFMKLNSSMDMIIKNAKRVRLMTKIVSVALNTQTLKVI